MKYYSLNMDNYKLHIIKTNKFKKVNISFNFRRYVTKEDIVKREFLVDILTESTKKYKSNKELQIRTEELYNLYGNNTNIKSGKVSIIESTISFLNEKYTEKGMFNASVDFLYEILFNPDVNNKCFNKEKFNFVKNLIKDNIKSRKDDPQSYSTLKLINEIDKTNPYSYYITLNELNKITPKSLFEYYKDVIDNDIIDIFIIGDITNNNINYIKNKFKFKNREYIKLDHKSKYINKCKELITKETMPINQSILKIGYTFDDLSFFEERYVIYVLNYILGGSPSSLLFTNIREKSSLCYQVSSGNNLLGNILFIQAGIDKDNFEKTKDLVIKQVKKLQTGDFNSNDIMNAKKCFINGCLTLNDTPSSIIGIYKSREFINSELVNKRIKQIQKVTKNDIITLANKMKLSKIYFIEGDLNEKK